MNSGKTQSEALNHTYANKHDAFPATAFSNTSVNPIIKNPGISNSKTNYNGASANFFELRIPPTNIGTENENFVEADEPLICGNAYDTVVNRILPSTNKTTLANYVANKQTTQSNKLRVYNANATVTGQLLVGSTGPGIDLAVRDYFVLINPEVTGDDGAVKIRPHFAKIKKVISYDIYGDGFEFEPKYPSTIPKDTNFEVYEGPKVTNTNVIAVSYGLRGQPSADGGLSDK